MNYSLFTKKTWTETRTDLRETFAKWESDTERRIDWSIDTPVGPARAHSYLSPADRTVSLSFVHPTTGQEVVLTMNAQARPVDNLRVLYLAVEAMRMNEKRGIGEVMREAYLQLPAPAVERDPYEVLGVRSDSPPEVIEASYRALAKKLHPDAGGDEEAFKELRAAYEKVRVPA